MGDIKKDKTGKLKPDPKLRDYERIHYLKILMNISKRSKTSSSKFMD